MGEPQHVDFVFNEFIVLRQIRFAVAKMGNDEIEFTALSSSSVGTLAELLGPAAERVQTLRDITALYNGSYGFATLPHENSRCPFVLGDVLPFLAPEPPETRDE